MSIPSFICLYTSAIQCLIFIFERLANVLILSTLFPIICSKLIFITKPFIFKSPKENKTVYYKMADCQICCEKLKNPITCNYCELTTCRKCVQKYLLSIVEDPHCMGCRKGWSREFLDDSCTAVFRNGDLKRHREQVLMEREKSLLPATQHAVEAVKRSRKRDELVAEIQARQRQLRQELSNLERQRWEIYRQTEQGGDLEALRKERNVTTRKCPHDNCKGFLDAKWHCGLCENDICKDCNQVKGEEHVCREEDIATATAIEKDTHPCPKCGMRIFKIMGCDQMYCTMCQTAFSWRTGNIVTNNIHNPHYYEFMRQNGGGQAPRNDGDVPCGGLPRNIFDLQLERTIGYYRADERPRHFQRRTMPARHAENPEVNRCVKLFDTVSELHRLLTHVEHWEFRKYPTNNTEAGLNEHLRVRYMMDEISEEQWSHELQKNEKARLKKSEIGQVLRMFHEIGAEQFRIIMAERHTQFNEYLDNMPVVYERFLQYMENVRQYSNTSMERISKRYNCTYPYITSGWRVPGMGHM